MLCKISSPLISFRSNYVLYVQIFLSPRMRIMSLEKFQLRKLSECAVNLLRKNFSKLPLILSGLTLRYTITTAGLYNERKRITRITGAEASFRNQP